MDKVGVIHGRFQPLHNAHMEYLLAARSRCDFLYIGISNPDPRSTREDEADRIRSRPEANPFSYYERLLMICRAFKAEGISTETFCIVPFPINFPQLLKFYVPLDGTFYMTIYDEWGEKKRQLFEKLRLKVDVMWKDRPKLMSGADVRQRIHQYGPWEELVPPVVATLMKDLQLDRRVQEIRGAV